MEKIKTTVIVDKDIYEWFRKRAFDDRLSIAELIRQAMKEYRKKRT